MRLLTIIQGMEIKGSSSGSAMSRMFLLSSVLTITTALAPSCCALITLSQKSSLLLARWPLRSPLPSLDRQQDRSLRVVWPFADDLALFRGTS